jgi:hypothetical protein
MVSSSISTDARVRALPCAQARLLFTWALTHADNLGRMRAEPGFVRAVVLPHEDATDADVEGWLANMARLGLVELYEADGGRFLQFRAWAKHQRLARMKRSDLPPPPDREPLDASGQPVASDGQPLASNGVRTDSTGAASAGEPLDAIGVRSDATGALKGGEGD